MRLPRKWGRMLVGERNKDWGCYFVIVLCVINSYESSKLKLKIFNLALSNEESNSECKDLLLDDGMTR